MIKMSFFRLVSWEGASVDDYNQMYGEYGQIKDGSKDQVYYLVIWFRVFEKFGVV